MQLVAKNLLTDYAAQFKGKTKGQLLRWAVGQKLRSTLSGTGKLKGDLRHEETQAAFFQLREERMLHSAGARLRRLTAGGRNTAYAAFTAMQTELLALSHAHVERFVWERFTAGIAACPDAGLRPALTTLRDLFALSHLEKGRAWFFENAGLPVAASREITRQVDELCAEVRREAVALVDGFGIPAACLAAPIALD